MKRPALLSILPGLLAVFFALIYGLISFGNHYNFRTYALDLGYYTQALHQYGRFQLAREWMINSAGHPMLGDHFDLYLPLFSPLSRIFGSWTLLLIQIVALLLGGIGAYRYAQHRLQSRHGGLWAMGIFYAFYGVFSAVAFDYHSVVVAASLFPWWWFSVYENHPLKAWTLWLFMLAAQENVALWLFFCGIGSLLRTDIADRMRFQLVGMILLAGLWFVVLVGWLMPSLRETEHYALFWYASLGSDPWQAFLQVIRHPLDALGLWFINHTSDTSHNGIKTETWIFLLLSGLPLLMVQRMWLWTILPLFGQKFWHDLPIVWSVHHQYNIEFAPLFALGLTDFVKDIHMRIIRRLVGVLLLAGVVGVSIRLMDNTRAFSDKTRIRFYTAEHYRQPSFNASAARRLLNTLPPGASVCAQSPFVPHLALRDSIYQFPLHHPRTQYIILAPKASPYPMDTVRFRDLAQTLLSNPDYEIQTPDSAFFILKKKR
jgi:uncharacterized membrane protein